MTVFRWTEMIFTCRAKSKTIERVGFSCRLCNDSFHENSEHTKHIRRIILVSSDRDKGWTLEKQAWLAISLGFQSSHIFYLAFSINVFPLFSTMQHFELFPFCMSGIERKDTEYIGWISSTMLFQREALTNLYGFSLRSAFLSGRFFLLYCVYRTYGICHPVLGSNTEKFLL